MFSNFYLDEQAGFFIPACVYDVMSELYTDSSFQQLEV